MIRGNCLYDINAGTLGPEIMPIFLVGSRLFSFKTHILYRKTYVIVTHVVHLELG